MRTTKISFLLLILFTSLSFAQQKDESHKMVEFQMALIKTGPRWTATADKDREPILREHFMNVMSMLASGQAVIAGPMADNTGLAGIIILRAASAAQAKTLVDADPAIKAGLFAAEMHPWWSEDIFKKPESPLKLDTLYLGFLKKARTEKTAMPGTPRCCNYKKIIWPTLIVSPG